MTPPKSALVESPLRKQTPSAEDLMTYPPAVSKYTQPLLYTSPSIHNPFYTQPLPSPLFWGFLSLVVHCFSSRLDFLTTKNLKSNFWVFLYLSKLSRLSPGFDLTCFREIQAWIVCRMLSFKLFMNVEFLVSNCLYDSEWKIILRDLKRLGSPLQVYLQVVPPPQKKTEKETKLSLEEHIKKNVYDCIQRNIMYMCAYRPRTIFGLSNQ